MAKDNFEQNPFARLPWRESDLVLPTEQYLTLSAFKGLKRKPTVKKFPETFVVRRFRKGEVIVRQGEPGYTAFAVLTTEDALASCREELKHLGDPAARRVLEKLLAFRFRDTATDATGLTSDRLARLPEEIERLQGRATDLTTAGPKDPRRAVATVHLVTARPSARKPGLLNGLLDRLLGRQTEALPNPKYIPIDAPTNVPYDSRQAPMFEGDVFGELSARYGTPRSATVVAERDCYVVEMLRNMVEALYKDEGFSKRMKEVYKDRVLENHLRRLSIFEGLTDEQFEMVRDGLREDDLLTLSAGALICDEHERSDCMYLVRRGLVKVIKNGSALLGPDEVADWDGLAAQLRDAEPSRRFVASQVPAGLLPAEGTVPAANRADLRHALNDLIRRDNLFEAKELQATAGGPAVKEALAILPATPKTWTGRDRRVAQRVLLEAVLPGALKAYRKRATSEYILNYCSAGDFIGEMGLMREQPRSATCVAHVHPHLGKDAQALDFVELVRIPGPLFKKLVESSPELKAKVNAEVKAREQRDVKRLAVSPWDEAQAGTHSKRFEELGLIQGQRLMLIDLDRCTRCDECVQACVRTHADGRSRLFLDGPRFGQYLVPTTCRSCRDPVCMVGCPVGSIYRGDNNEMVIRDWCIGCGLCAKNCPYDSIQMHDIGLIRESALGWWFAPTSGAADGWEKPGASRKGWRTGRAPFTAGRTFAEESGLGTAGPFAVCFRYFFPVEASALKSAKEFRLEVVSSDADAAVWLNGSPLSATEKAKRGRRPFLVKAGEGGLRAGENVLAVRVNAAADPAVPVLDARLDEVSAPVTQPGMADLELSQKLVRERAVVCDLCSQQWGQRPACVTACPHDAAMRVDARTEFPRR